MERESWYLDSQADSVYSNADFIVFAMAVAQDPPPPDGAPDADLSPRAPHVGNAVRPADLDIFEHYWIADTCMEQEW